jgi:hypothetical protein
MTGDGPTRTRHLPGPLRRLAAVAAVALTALALAPTGRAAPGDGMHWLTGSYSDYAPVGMPDFSQCRPEWSQPGTPGQWTYAGPVALADVLWWLDSAAEPDPQPPGTPSDGYPLVTAYPVFGPAVDDHNTANLFPLVEDLAGRAGTDGRGRPALTRGTRWEDLVAATDGYLQARRLMSAYHLVTVGAPAPAWLAEQVSMGAGAVVLLGVWEAQEDGWRRVGGHYAAVAGFDGETASLALADPLADTAALGGTGRAIPPDSAVHSCREAPRAHDDAAVVTHDAYPLRATAGLPDGRYILDGYFRPDNEHEAAAFQGQNPMAALKPWSAGWRRGHVVMALDAALAIVPSAGHPANTELPPTAPPTVAPPTATATDTPIAPTAAAATATLAPAEPGTVGPGRGLRRLWLPLVRRGGRR